MNVYGSIEGTSPREEVETLETKAVQQTSRGYKRILIVAACAIAGYTSYNPPAFLDNVVSSLHDFSASSPFLAEQTSETTPKKNTHGVSTSTSKTSKSKTSKSRTSSSSSKSKTSTTSKSRTTAKTSKIAKKSIPTAAPTLDPATIAAEEALAEAEAEWSYSFSYMAPSPMPTSNALVMTLTNKYILEYGTPGKDYPWISDYDLTIVEPNRITYLSVSGDAVDGCQMMTQETAREAAINSTNSSSRNNSLSPLNTSSGFPYGSNIPNITAVATGDDATELGDDTSGSDATEDDASSGFPYGSNIPNITDVATEDDATELEDDTSGSDTSSPDTTGTSDTTGASETSDTTGTSDSTGVSDSSSSDVAGSTVDSSSGHHRRSLLKENMLTYSCAYVWKVWGEENNLIGETEGQSTTFIFEDVGKYRVTVQQWLVPSDVDETQDGTLVLTHTKRYACKYVRREARKLFTADRFKLLHTMRALYDTNYTTGIQLYGPKYRDMTYFVKKHAELAGDFECDHLHEGLGFLTNHMAFTLEFEQALQVVSPDITVPYWDYTIDAVHASNSHKDDLVSAWRNSELFQPEWFGTTSPNNEYKTATDGIFGLLKVPQSYVANWSTTTNAYGYLRSPWNFNRDPYVARYNLTFEFETDIYPECTDYIDVLNYDTWIEFGMNIANGAHGPIHGMLGGAWRPDYTFEKAERQLGKTKAKLLVEMSVSSYPQFWRSGIVTCPEYCTMDTSPELCQCGCSQMNDTHTPVDINGTMTEQDVDWDSYVKTAEAEYKTLEDTGVLEHFARKDIKETTIKRIYDDDDVSYEWVGADLETSVQTTHWFYTMVCNPGLTGDILGSGSPVDPIFWLIHPTVDRLWQWKRLSTSCGYNYSWPSGTSIYGNCWGHDKDDVLDFTGLGDGETPDGSKYSNSDIYEIMDPNDGKVPYIYDDFKWDHCLSSGTDVRGFCTGDTYVTDDDRGMTTSSSGDDDGDDFKSTLKTAAADDDDFDPDNSDDDDAYGDDDLE